MIKIISGFFTIALMALLAGCSSSGSGEYVAFEKGDYTFQMKDSAGGKLVDGNLTVVNVQGNNVSGTYTFTKKYVDDFPGLSSMGGEFAGNVSPDQKTVSLNTNPKIADANVFVSLTAGKYSFYGNWAYSTMRGTLGKGRITVSPAK